MDNLERLKYTELRNLAKKLGLRAKGKSDKLIRDIRKHYQGDNTKSTISEKKSSSSSTSSSLSFEGEEGRSPLTKPKKGPSRMDESVDDEIVFMIKNDESQNEEENQENNEANKSSELESIEDKFGEIEAEHNRTVEFEDRNNQTTKSEDVDVNEQLNTTFEIVDVKDNQEEEDLAKREMEKLKNESVQDLLEVMKPEMTDEEMKAELMAAIDKKVKSKKVTIMSPNASVSTSEFVSRIPTFSTHNKPQSNEDKTNLKGKDWGKIHEKLFSKLDPLDVYLEKKNRRMQKMNTPLKSAKRIAAESQKTAEKIRKRKGVQSPSKPSNQKPGESQSFIPKITSTKSMSLHFTTTTSTVESVTKSSRTPVSSSSKNKMGKTSPNKLMTDSAKKTVKQSLKLTPQKSPMVVKKPFSPFNFGNKSLSQTPDSTKKAKFDLQASLAKPITWKKHTGKLRPIAFGDVGPQYFKKGLNTSIQTNRENRRAVTAKSRANKRDNILNSRRNIKS